MTFHEIKTEIPTASLAKLIDLAKEFDKQLQSLAEKDDSYLHFSEAFGSNINKLKFTRDPDNEHQLMDLVESVLEMGRILKLQRSN